MAPGSVVSSAKQLPPVTILAVANSTVDQNATNAMEETYANYLMYKFLQIDTISGV